jgi:hypothetical protein
LFCSDARANWGEPIKNIAKPQSNILLEPNLENPNKLLPWSPQVSREHINSDRSTNNISLKLPTLNFSPFKQQASLVNFLIT